MTALGRQETWEDSPEGYPETPPYKGWNWHDNYDAEPTPHPKWVDLLTDPEGAAIRRRDAEPIHDPNLADAEEEEIAELWAGDPGNQGA